jgi:hypothetical protein
VRARSATVALALVAMVTLVAVVAATGLGPLGEGTGPATPVPAESASATDAPAGTGPEEGGAGADPGSTADRGETDTAATGGAGAGSPGGTGPTGQGGAAEVPEIRLGAGAGQGELPPVADQLAPAAVLRLSLSGFEADRTGTMRQCLLGLEEGECGVTLPVRFDEWGRAEVLFFALAQPIEGGSAALDCERRRCVIEVSDGTGTAELETVFGAAAPPPLTLRISPRGRFSPGEVAEIRVTASAGDDGRSSADSTDGVGPPERVLDAVLCLAGERPGDRCRALTSVPPSGLARFTVTEAQVAECQNQRCVVVLVDQGTLARAAPTPFPVGHDRPVRYDPYRLAVGLALAGTAVALALLAVRRVDWTLPPEAATPELDRVPYADLDAEAETFAERN